MVQTDTLPERLPSWACPSKLVSRRFSGPTGSRLGSAGTRRGGQAAARSRAPRRRPGAGDGPRLRRGRDTPTGARPRLHTRGSAAQDPAHPLGVGPGDRQAAQRNRMSVPTTERLPAHLLTLREPRCAVPRPRPFRTHLRCSALGESLKNPCRDSGIYGQPLIFRSSKRFKQGAMEFFRPSLGNL